MQSSHRCDVCESLTALQGTAIASLLAGQATTFMQQRDWHTLKIRTVCQDIATIGEASLVTEELPEVHAADCRTDYTLESEMHTTIFLLQNAVLCWRC